MSERYAVHSLDRVALNVSDLGTAMRFYCEALGFAVTQEPSSDPKLVRLLGVDAAHSARLGRGRQILELSALDPPGAPMHENSRSNDIWFQHCALVTSDMVGAYERLRQFEFTPISRFGPQTLPGGITAYKFRDPDGHPLELISFPTPDPATLDGIDHSAMSVADTASGIAFYTGVLGLTLQARQINHGPAQDALDGLDGVTVDVVALAPSVPAPHLELLGYQRPSGRAGVEIRPGDIAASRLVFGASAMEEVLLHDPDGHLIVLEQ